MTELNLTELRKVAEAATPGPWQMWNDGHVGCPDVHLGGIFMPTTMSDPDRRWDDARFASTFDPPTVLALLDRVAELEAVVGRVERVYRSEYRIGSRDGCWKRLMGRLHAALAGESDE